MYRFSYRKIWFYLLLLNGIPTCSIFADAKSDCTLVTANLTYQEKQYNNEAKLKTIVNNLGKVNADTISDKEEEIETQLQEIEDSIPDQYEMLKVPKAGPYGPNLPSYAQGRTTTFQQKNDGLLRLLIKDIKDIVHSTLATYKKLAELKNAE